MKRLFWFWARVVIYASPKSLDAPILRLRAFYVARLLVIIVPAVLILAHMLILDFAPALMHFSAVTVMAVLLPLWALGMWRIHKLKIYFQRKNNAPE